MIHEGEGVAAKALESLGISLEAVREKVEETIGMAGTAPNASPPFTPRAKKVLELALREALLMDHSYIGTEHLLLGLVREGEGVAATVLVSLGADLGRVRQEVIGLMTGGREPRREAGSTTTHPSLSLEPCCPRCRQGLSEVAQFRTMVVPPDSEEPDPMSIDVVYCVRCGTSLQMFKNEGPR